MKGMTKMSAIVLAAVGLAALISLLPERPWTEKGTGRTPQSEEVSPAPVGWDFHYHMYGGEAGRSWQAWVLPSGQTLIAGKSGAPWLLPAPFAEAQSEKLKAITVALEPLSVPRELPPVECCDRIQQTVELRVGERTIGPEYISEAIYENLLAIGSALIDPLEHSGSGEAEVLNGDTLQFQNIRVKLWALDTPEAGRLCQRGGANWACGDEALRTLAGLVAGAHLQCETRGMTRDGTRISKCWLPDGEDLGGAMVDRGLARAQGEEGQRIYGDRERTAQTAKVGLWAS